MASTAQILANQANAQLSTGPRTAAGKARSARNNLRHGLTLGVLAIDPAEQAEFCEFEANFRAEMKPAGALENEALRQFLDAAWRLRKIRVIVRRKIEELGDDPLVVPETDAELRQLTRYRAAAEMLAYRAIRTLRELQTARLFRLFHLTPEEQEVLPPLARPGEKIMLDGVMHAHNDREIFYHLHGAEIFTSRFDLPVRTQSPPDASCADACYG